MLLSRVGRESTSFRRSSIEWTERLSFPLGSNVTNWRRDVCVVTVAWLTDLSEVRSDVLTTILVGGKSNRTRLLRPRATNVTWVPDSGRLWVGEWA